MHQIERLADDPFALSEFLGLDRSSAIRAGATTLQQVQAWATEGRMESSVVDRLRWELVERLLWEAAQGEAWERQMKQMEGRRLITSSVGVGWGKAKTISKSWSIRWRQNLFDLFEHPAVRDAMGHDLYGAIYDILKAQHDYQKELEELRSNPDVGRLKALRDEYESASPPPPMADAIRRLRAFVQGVERKTMSKHGSRAGRGNGKKFVNESDAEQVTVEQYEGWLKAARTAGNESRAQAIGRIAKESGRSRSTIANAASRVWPAKEN